MFGKHHTEETKQKLREINLRKTLTEGHKQKLIIANTGRVKTEDELRKLSENNKGKHNDMKNHKESFHKMMDSLCEFEY